MRPSFGAFGERRDGIDWLGPVATPDMNVIAGITRRGFTGHEHLDSVGLIHMNGRVYDPAVGRFLGVDPILRMGISQDVNGYSYAWNSPLNIVDPSGLVEDDLTPVQCIGADFCPGSNAPPGAFDDVTVTGRRIDTPAGGWGSVSGTDLANQMPSWGSGIDLAIDLGNGIERQFAGPDGEVNVTATRLGTGATFAAGGFVAGALGIGEANAADETGEETTCKPDLINWGNKLAQWSQSASNTSAVVVSGGILATGTGLVLSATGVGAPGGVPLTAYGVAATAAGGGLGILAGGLQIGAGVLQGLGGASYQNAYNGVAAIGSGLVIGRALGPLIRSGNYALSGGTSATGGVYDLLVMYVESLAPRTDARCSP